MAETELEAMIFSPDYGPRDVSTEATVIDLPDGGIAVEFEDSVLIRTGEMLVTNLLALLYDSEGGPSWAS